MSPLIQSMARSSFRPETETRKLTLPSNVYLTGELDGLHIADYTVLETYVPKIKQIVVELCIAKIKYCDLCIMNRCPRNPYR